MASLCYLEIFLASIITPFLFIVFRQYLKRKINQIPPSNWPILGTIPNIINNLHRVHDFCTDILQQTGCNFFIKGIWFANIDFLLTADPANIRYIMNTNFERYPKGPEFKYIFDILGDGIFNSDSNSWKNQRKIANSIIHDPKFLQFLVNSTKKKVEKGLFPVLESVCRNGLVIDLQDLFQRFTFDSTCLLVTGFDFNSLSIEFPQVPFSKAMDDAQEIIFLRHLYPKIVWELEKKLDFGHAKKMRQAWETIDQVIAKLMDIKRSRPHDHHQDEEGVDLITLYLSSENDQINFDDKFLRDTILNFMIAGRDTVSSALSWFFFCVSNNPIVESKIREELKEIIEPNDEARKQRIFSIEELNKLIYLHAALCETLRLYPSVPFEHKVPSQHDILPSGHHVNPKTKILFSLYALGRISCVWGKDCMEFKPERWISEKGTMKYVPSYKFLAFNTGPRTCLGKEVAFTQMKMVVASIIHNYNIQQIGHHVSTNASIILHMKHGFKVKITNRWS